MGTGMFAVAVGAERDEDLDGDENTPRLPDEKERKRGEVKKKKRKEKKKKKNERRKNKRTFIYHFNFFSTHKIKVNWDKIF
jgi:hypothetical protein